MRKKLQMLIWTAVLILLPVAQTEPVLPADASAEIPAENAYVALTFDDGPHRGTTDLLLDGLLKRGASATFFLVGEQIAGNEDLVERMQAEDHQVGNHTWSHKSLEKADTAAFREEIRKADDLLRQLLGDGTYWLRPPYGQLSEEELLQVEVPLVKWSVDPRDWESRNTEKVVQAILGAVEPGSIVLLHDIYPTSVEAALQVIDILQEKGYEFVTVEELLRLNGITPQSGVLYRSGKGTGY